MNFLLMAFISFWQNQTNTNDGCAFSRVRRPSVADDFFPSFFLSFNSSWNENLSIKTVYHAMLYRKHFPWIKEKRRAQPHK